MTDRDTDALRRRFGPDPARWPAPHAMEAAARRRPDDAAGDPDAGLDALVCAASAMETDERATAGAVRARIASSRQRVPGPARLPAPGPAAFGAAVAALLLVAGLAGYALTPAAVDREIAALALGPAEPAVALGLGRP